MFHRDFLAPSGSGLGFRAGLPSFLSFLFSGIGRAMNSLLRMNVVETWFVAVWGLCWCNFEKTGRTLMLKNLHFAWGLGGCDVILVNADGRVVESGNHAELMALKGPVKQCLVKKLRWSFIFSKLYVLLT